MESGLEKIFVLDTNVILFDPQAILKFGPQNTVFIPLIVVEEVDRFKKIKMRMVEMQDISQG